MKAANLVSEAVRWSDAGVCWEEKITNNTGSIEVAKRTLFRVRATGSTTVTIDGVLAATLVNGEIDTFNSGDGNPDSGKKTVTVTIGVAAAYVQVSRETARPKLFPVGTQLLASQILSGGFSPTLIANPGVSISDISGQPLVCNRTSPAFCIKNTSFDTTNLTPWPEQLDSWPLFANDTVTPNAVVAPDGTTSAAKVTFTSASAASYVGNAFSNAYGTVANGGAYIASIYLKAGSAQDLLFRVVDMTNGGVVIATTTVSLTNNWQRVIIYTGNTTIQGNRLGLILESATTTGTFYAWGAKLESLNISSYNQIGASPWDVQNVSSSNPTYTLNATTAPDGTLTASKITSYAITSGKSELFQGSFTQLPAGTYTFSFYAKSVATTDTIRGSVQFGNGVGNTGFSQAINSTDWTLVSVTGTSNALGNVYAVFGNNSLYHGTAAQFSAYVWGARIDAGTQRLGGYSSPMLVSLTNNIPRVETNGLLVEGTSTNLLTYASQFDHSPTWTGIGSSIPTVTADQAIAPDGTLTADLLSIAAISGAGNYGDINQSYTTSGAGTYTASIYVRGASTSGTIYLALLDGSTWHSVACNYTANNWSRFSVTATTSGAGTLNFIVGVDLRTGSGQSAQAAQNVYIWGSQLENLPFASSLMNSGASTVTRSGDLMYVPSTLPSTATGFRVNMTITPINGRAWNYDSTVTAAAWALNLPFGANSAYSQISGDSNIYGFAYDATSTRRYGFAPQSFADGSTQTIEWKLFGNTWFESFDGVGQSVTMGNTGTGISGMADNFYIGSIGSGGYPAYAWIKDINLYLN